jgi:hypothetical protein
MLLLQMEVINNTGTTLKRTPANTKTHQRLLASLSLHVSNRSISGANTSTGRDGRRES